MFKFDKEQTVFDFGGVKMGGQPGEYLQFCVVLSFTADTTSLMMN